MYLRLLAILPWAIYFPWKLGANSNSLAFIESLSPKAIAMSLAAPRRGRPKGTGIDDQTQLLRIAAMIAANPDMKPTTAIKALGISDPSVIRRLRDKFHAFATDVEASAQGDASTGAPMAPVASKMAPQVAARGTTVTLAARSTYSRKSAAKSSAAVQAEAARTADPPLAPTPMITAPATDTTASGDPAMATAATLAAPASDAAAAWLGMGLAAFASAISAQMALAQGVIRNPFVEIVIRQQLACQEMALALAPRHFAAKH